MAPRARSITSATVPKPTNTRVSWGRVEAQALARTIADHAAKRFPNIEFRIDSEWHSHDQVLGWSLLHRQPLAALGDRNG